MVGKNVAGKLKLPLPAVIVTAPVVAVDGIACGILILNWYIPSANPVAFEIFTVASLPKQILLMLRLPFSRFANGRTVKPTDTLVSVLIQVVPTLAIVIKLIVVAPIFRISAAGIIKLPTLPEIVTLIVSFGRTLFPVKL